MLLTGEVEAVLMPVVFKAVLYNITSAFLIGLLKELSHLVQPGDLIVATDIESYSIIHSYMLRQEKTTGKIPLERFYFFFYPDQLRNYDRRFLKIHNDIEDVLPADMEALHGFVPFRKGKRTIRQIQFEELNFSRIWLVAATPLKEGLWEANSLAIKEYLGNELEHAMTKERSGVHIELFTKTKADVIASKIFSGFVCLR